MVKAVIFDVFGVIHQGDLSEELLSFIDELHDKYTVAIFTSATKGFFVRMVPQQHLASIDEVFAHYNMDGMKPDPRRLKKLPKV